MSKHFWPQFPPLQNEFWTGPFQSSLPDPATHEEAGEGIIREIFTDKFPGGPVVRTPCSHFRGHRFDPWSGN